MSTSNGRTRNDDLEEITGAENGGGELRDIEENFVEELTGQGEEMGNRRESGLEPEINQLQGDYNFMMQNNEDIGFPSYTPSQSPQHSPHSVVDSVSSSSNIPLEMNRASDLLMAVSLVAEENKSKIIELANSAMEELERKANGGEPLWQRQVDSKIEILNEAEYIREFRAFDATLKEIMRMIEMGDSSSSPNLECNSDFTNGNQHKYTFPQEAEPDGLQTEASREIGFISMNATSIVELFMDLKQWSSAFSKIVSKATILGVLSLGMTGNYEETLQVMSAEFHMPTPLVPIRECQFARYSKQLGSNTWGIVDVSLENLFPYPAVRYRRRPSGCLIQQMPNGYSKVTWVEHVEVDNSQVHWIFQSLVLSGFAFSARRWVSTLIQHCEWIKSLMSQISLVIDKGLIPLKGKESLLRLAERMMRSFCLDLSASTNNFWMPFPLNGDEDFRVMSKSFTAISGCPMTTSIAFTSSLWLPSSPDRVFHVLRHADFRHKWDLLSRDLMIQEIAHVTMGENLTKRVSIMQANCDPERTEILYLQESISDPSASSYVVYAPMDVESVSAILSGGNPDSVNILPSGFVIHPDHKLGKNNNGDHGVFGSILTLSFHILDGSSTEDSIAGDSIDTAYRILTETAASIKAVALSNEP